MRDIRIIRKCSIWLLRYHGINPENTVSGPLLRSGPDTVFSATLLRLRCKTRLPWLVIGPPLTNYQLRITIFQSVPPARFGCAPPVWRAHRSAALQDSRTTAPRG